MYRREILLLLACLLAVGCVPDPNPGPPIVVDRIVIDTFSPNLDGSNGVANDTIVTLFDSDGTVLATDDDSSPMGLGYSRIDHTAGLPAGTFYIKVHKEDPWDGGVYYALRVLDYEENTFLPAPGLLVADEEPPSDDATVGGIPTDPGSIVLNGAIQNRWLNPEETDVDWFELIITP